MNSTIAEKIYSEGVISRLSQYLKCIVQLKETGKRTVTSREISDNTGINSAEVRRDLIYFEIKGKRGVGFNISPIPLKSPIMNSQYTFCILLRR